MDMANFVACRLGRIPESEYERIHSVLARNYHGFGSVEIPFEPFVSALARDKKNRGESLGLILKGPKGVERVYIEDRETILRACADFFRSERLV
jgi:3-dehydroquinate synthetase